ncbi:hypothetical protein OSB94_02815 [Proteus vulgaris]|nr:MULTISPECIES: hypothetical protein [Proteus]MBQ0212566.1 hypothetical protein [Proteus vulgaris]MDS0787020.1 hypothetical protein [Proteus vulgaris]NBM53847.1 hypothetical protein [Proteus sp. G2669]UPK80483.1 hypothetical protein LW139_17080 [Proteus vulgaris]
MCFRHQWLHADKQPETNAGSYATPAQRSEHCSNGNRKVGVNLIFSMFLC